MSVASKNPFALLNDAEPEVTPAPVTPVVEAPKPNRKPQSTRGGRYYQRGGPKLAVTSPVVEGEAPASPAGEKKFNRGERGDRPFRGERGERGDRGRGRGGRGRGRGGDRDPRPDRHSTTGVTDSQKKVHQGWGGDRGDTELKDETNGANDASAGDNWGAPATEGWDAPVEKAGDDAADPWADPAPAEGAEGETKDDAGKPAGDDEGRRRKRFEDEEDEGKMTLEEWRAKNAPAETVPKLEPRKIAEGSSEFFKDAKQLLKTEDNDYFAGKPKATSAPRARKESKQFIEIDAHFDPPSRGGRGRGGGRGGRGYGDSPRGDRPERGGRGGRGGYGGGRNQQQQQRGVDVDDATAFPSL